MRGKQNRVGRRGLDARITPACAGKTFRGVAQSAARQDHPRACEENEIRNPCLYSLSGSPPRMRGKLLFGSGHFVVAGITPAHAGKTEPETVLCRTCMDHPRACGENVQIAHRSFSESGSPPRMRGKPPESAAFDRGCGITPAHAGKTQQDCED